MGLSVDTSRTFNYVLVDDRDKPADAQRTLVCRYLSARSAAQVERHFDSASPERIKSFDEVIAGVNAGLKLAVADWRNMVDDDGQPVPFNADDLDRVLSRADYVELRDNLLLEMTATLNEKKVAALRSQSTSAKSASQPVAGV